ncbi:hypothetical protein PG996_004589 [Apiospora saccharicola]|uniref:Aminoglycoside phosphotransferase domain-containing protein n=1 Tax=Apiospora saccharicola TaxID=335842 RepID=A0ABR1W4K6_9PEZI
MPSPPSESLDEIAASLLAKKGLELVSCRTVQSLWAGYGHICRVQARFPRGEGKGDKDESNLSLVLKFISPPASKRQDDEGHLRKILSYQVEQHFYAHLAPRLSQLSDGEDGDGEGQVIVAECLGSVHDGTTTALLLRDLQREVLSAYESCFQNNEEKAEEEKENMKKAAKSFPLALEKRGTLTPDLVGAALDWLAGFHGFFWRDEEKARYYTADMDHQHLVPPPLEFVEKAQSSTSSANGVGVVAHGVWQNGGYTYLATRRSEYASLEDDGEANEWSAALCQRSQEGASSSSSSVAEQAAYYVSPSHPATAAYATLIHGDVKSENMFGRSAPPSSVFTAAAKVAFFDFQYVGLGLGACDLAKLFTCSVPVSMFVPSSTRRSMPSHLGMQDGEKALLERYLARVEAVSGKPYPWDVFVAHWEAALVDWLRFQASWGFWGNTEWLEARVRDVLSRRTAETWGEAEA